jgi:hypothetical protein
MTFKDRAYFSVSLDLETYILFYFICVGTVCARDVDTQELTDRASTNI